MSRTQHIAFVSPLGGTGQTSLVANLASLWSTPEQPALAVDLCAQNSLGLHLGQTGISSSGWAAEVEAGRWWAEAAQENSAGVRFLPFGHMEGSLPQQPADWLASQLQSVALEDHSLVLLDAPAWPHALAMQALHVADLVVVCLDTTPRVPHMAAQVQALLQQAPPGTPLAVLATGFNPRRASQRQTLQALQAQWADALSPYVLHDDENMAAALAASQCVISYAPQAQAAHDLQGIARWLLARCRPAGDRA